MVDPTTRSLWEQLLLKGKLLRVTCWIYVRHGVCRNHAASSMINLPHCMVVLDTASLPGALDVVPVGGGLYQVRHCSTGHFDPISPALDQPAMISVTW